MLSGFPAAHIPGGGKYSKQCAVVGGGSSKESWSGNRREAEADLHREGA